MIGNSYIDIDIGNGADNGLILTRSSYYRHLLSNHHHDPVSASTQHKWREFDITYYVILLLKSLGIASNVRQPRHIRQKR